METIKEKPKEITEYIQLQTAEVQPRLQKIRETIRQTIPDAIEVISYGMPAFKYEGKILLYFATFKNHIGFYATPSANIFFYNDLKRYKTTKGAIQFPHIQPIPYDLIVKITQYKADEIRRKKKTK
ncbi:MAG: iron chaperone [Paludibacteraceae bacterium]